MTTSTNTSASLGSSISGSLSTQAVGLMSTGYPSFGNTINVKLSHDAYLLWKVQVLPVLSGARWLGLVEGTDPTPPQLNMASTKDGATQVPNPAYTVWLQRDQTCLSLLLSTLSPEVLG